ncbi:DUF4247 domain-containing protein [Streptomyces sp. NPDC048290]|uniref:DUF4247 domain-containing protein n=1 Tax=Streptomyces sp. NPDC048290 TaxID=3155811 RepID=UPI00341EC2A5
MTTVRPTSMSRRTGARPRTSLPRRLAVALLVMGAVTACSGDGDGDGAQHNAVPRQWIQDQYPAGPGATGYRDTANGPATVAEEINGRASAADRSTGGRTVYLRYRDDIVAVTPQGRGSLIEIADYRSGYRRWSTNLPNHWPHPDSDSFRGGGPGSGK